MIDITIRPYLPSDKDFLYASWLHNYKHSSSFAKRIRNDLYYYWHEKIITMILLRKTTSVMVACLPEDTEVILGYIVTENYMEKYPVIHYCLVKKEWRNMGIAKALFTIAASKDIETYFSHWTDPMDSLVNHKDLKLTYDPYKI